MSDDAPAEEQKPGWRRLLDDIIHAWPVLAIVGSLVLFLGETYVTNIAEAVWDEKAKVSPTLTSIKGDLDLIRADLDNKDEADQRIQARIEKVDGKVDQVLLILTQD